MMKKALVLLLVAMLAVPVFAAEPAKFPFQTPDTMLVVRTKNLQEVVTKISDIVNSFQPGAGAMIMMQFQNFLQKDGQAINPNGPAAIIILDPEKYQNQKPLVLVFSLKDANFQTQQGFFKIMGTAVAVGENEQAVTAVADAMKAAGIKDIPVDDITDTIVADAPIGAVVTKFRPKIKQGIDEFRKQLQARAATEPPDVAKTLNIGLKLADQLEILMNEVEKQAGPARLALSFDNNNIKGSLKATFTPNSPTAVFVKDQNKPFNPAVAMALPEKAVVTTLMQHNPASVEKIAGGIINIMATVLEIPAPDRDKIKGDMSDFVKTMTGTQGDAMVQTEDGIAKISVIGLKDGQAGRAAMKKFYDDLNAGAFGKKMQDFGIKLTYTGGHREVNGVKVDKVNVALDAQKLVSVLPIDPMERDDVQKKINDFMQMQHGKNNVDIELAFVGNNMVVINGKNAQKLMDSQIALVKSGAKSIADRPEFRESMAKVAQPGFAVTHIFIFDYMYAAVEALSKAAGPQGGPGFDQIKQFLPTRDQLPQKDVPIVLTARIDQQGALVIAADVPLQPIRDIFTIVMGNVMRKMQEQMQQQGGGQPGMPPQRPMPPRRVQPQPPVERVPAPEPAEKPKPEDPKKPNPQDEDFWK